MNGWRRGATWWLLLVGLCVALGAPTRWFAGVDHGGPDLGSVMRWEFAWPRALLAVMIGSGIGAAGWICQRVARNPLASPGLLGIPAAAATAVVVLLASAGGRVLASWAVPAAASIGGVVGAALLLLAVELLHSFDGTRVLLVGVALGGVFGAATFAIALTTEPVVYQFAMAWLGGSLATASWRDFALLHPPWALSIAVLLLATPRLVVLGFDDATAASLGLGVRRARRLAFLLAAGLTAICVSMGGAFGLLGFAAPHLARRVGGRAADRPADAAVAGAAALLLADGLGHSGWLGCELPAGVAVAGLCLPWLCCELLRVPLR